MSAALTMEAVTETYLDVEKLIYDTIHRFIEQYGGDFDEFLSIARESYMLAFNSYDPERAGFVTYVRCFIWGRLQKTWRVERRRAQILNLNHEYDFSHHPERSENKFDVSEFVEKLSEDGKTVVNLVFDSPIDIALSIMERGGDTPNNVRLAIREFLKDVGWSAGRVSNTFREIRKALQ